MSDSQEISCKHKKPARQISAQHVTMIQLQKIPSEQVTCLVGPQHSMQISTAHKNDRSEQDRTYYHKYSQNVRGASVPVGQHGDIKTTHQRARMRDNCCMHLLVADMYRRPVCSKKLMHHRRWIHKLALAHCAQGRHNNKIIICAT